jgi:hypothetical protein
MARGSSRADVSATGARFAARLTALSLTALVAACHTAPVNPWISVPSAGFAGRAFGDTVGLRTSIVAMDTVRDIAVFALAAPAHLVVLDVRPGVSIEQLQPMIGAQTVLQAAGEHMVATVDSTAQKDEAARLAPQAYECVDLAEMTARRRNAYKPPVVRDSSGKVTAASAEAQRRFEDAGSSVGSADVSGCSRALAANSSRMSPARKSSRVGEHYLVLLASQSPVSGTEVAERLKTLSVIGSDVATTIEAIGAGLFVGHAGSWSGYYVSR